MNFVGRVLSAEAKIVLPTGADLRDAYDEYITAKDDEEESGGASDSSDRELMLHEAEEA